MTLTFRLSTLYALLPLAHALSTLSLYSVSLLSLSLSTLSLSRSLYSLSLSQGMYYGGGEQTQINPQSQSLNYNFVSLVLKGKTDGFTIKGGDATSGTTTTMYDGPRPNKTIAGTCGGNSGGLLTLQTCVKGNAQQMWHFTKDGKHISNDNNQCIDIEGFGMCMNVLNVFFKYLFLVSLS